MSVRPLNAGPYGTYDEFDRVYDRAHKALNRETTTSDAKSMGYAIALQGEHLRYERDLKLRPNDGFTLQDKYLYGLQHGVNFDPLQWGMPFGRPVQGYGHNLVGSPEFPHPNWPALVPVPRPRPNHLEDEVEDGRTRYRPY